MILRKIPSLVFVLFAAILVLSGCTDPDSEKQPKSQTQVRTEKKPEQQIVCSKGLDFSVCNNSSALHGQIMIHNKTDHSYNVKVYHHGMENPEVQHIMPGSGWTFAGVLQGQRMIIATPMAGGEPEEVHCMVTGGMQHTIDITYYGIKQTDGHMSHGKS